MSAGNRNALVTFFRTGDSQDESGQHTETWAELGKEWANVQYGSGEERRTAAMEQGSQAAVFRVLDNAFTRGIKVKDKISHDGADWDITGTVPRDGEREFTGVRAS